MHRFGGLNNKTIYSFLVMPYFLNMLLDENNNKINSVSLKLIKDLTLSSPSVSPITTIESEESSPPLTPSSGSEIAETPSKKKVSFLNLEEGKRILSQRPEVSRGMLIPTINEYTKKDLENLYYNTKDLVPPSHLDERLEMYEEILSLDSLVDGKKLEGYQKAKESLEWISNGIKHLLSFPNITSKMQKDLERAKERLGNLPLISDVREAKIVKARFLQNLDQLKLLKTFIDAVDGIDLLLTLESLDSGQREILQKAQDGIRFCALEGHKFCIRLLNMPEGRPQEVVAFAKDFIEAVEAQFSEKTPSGN